MSWVTSYLLNKSRKKNIPNFCSFLLIAHIGNSSCHAFELGYKNGLKIKSDDGAFELGLNGRAHLDVHSIFPDAANANYPAFGSQLLNHNDRDGFNWRRTYATLTGKIHNINFKFENDFAVNATTAFPHSLREAWVATQLGPGQITIGQFKAYRGLEELTSSNEITLMERPSTSSTGLYSGRQFLTGIGYRGMIGEKLGFGVYTMSLSHFGLPFSGISYGGRAVWLPWNQPGKTLHLGFSVSRDTANKDSLSARIVDIYGGREGINKSLGIAGAALGSPVHNSQTTFSAEAAYAVRSLTLQGEYAISRLDNTHLLQNQLKDSLIQAFYVQASWFVTGEEAVYKKDRWAFGKPRPSNPWGAIELVVRYDLAENTSQNLQANPCKTGTSKCQVEIMTFGANWYPNPHVRFMFNYYLTESMIGINDSSSLTQKDNLSAFSFRTQFNF